MFFLIIHRVKSLNGSSGRDVLSQLVNLWPQNLNKLCVPCVGVFYYTEGRDLRGK